MCRSPRDLAGARGALVAGGLLTAGAIGAGAGLTGGRAVLGPAVRRPLRRLRALPAVMASSSGHACVGYGCQLEGCA